jgi:hypothetical protein
MTMGGRDEAPMFMLAITADLAMVARMFTLPIAAGPATVGRIMWLLATTGRLELVVALRSVGVRAVAPVAVLNSTPAGRLVHRAVRVTVSRRILAVEAIGRREPVVAVPRPMAATAAAGRLVRRGARVTTMSLIRLCETIVRRVVAAARSAAVRAVARVAVGTTCPLT